MTNAETKEYGVETRLRAADFALALRDAKLLSDDATYVMGSLRDVHHAALKAFERRASDKPSEAVAHPLAKHMPSNEWLRQKIERDPDDAEVEVRPPATLFTSSEAGSGVKGREITLFDWAWTDETGEQRYARTPERAARLMAEGHELTPVYTVREINPALPTQPAESAKSGDGVTDDLPHAARFLVDRLNDLEWSDLDETFRDFAGHVEPAIARLTTALRESSHD